MSTGTLIEAEQFGAFEALQELDDLGLSSHQRILWPGEIGIQGLLGSFSHEAANQSWSHIPDEELNLKSYGDFPGLFKALEDKDIESAIVPVFNTTAGWVRQQEDGPSNMMIMAEKGFRVVDTQIVPVRLCLAGISSATLEGIRRIHSHPVALAMCKQLIQEMLPDVELVPNDDTAGAIRDIVMKNSPEDAALGSQRAADVYNATILPNKVQTNGGDNTVFAALELQ